MIQKRLYGWKAGRVLAAISLLLTSCVGPQKNSVERSGKSVKAEKPSIEAETRLAAGRMHEANGQLDKAEEQYRLATEIEAGYVEAYNRLGLVRGRMRHFKEAEASLKKAIELAPDQAHLYNNLAFTYVLQASWKKAEEPLREAIRLAPDFTRAQVNLGMVLAQQDQYDEAFQHFKLVLPLESAYFNMGLMFQSRRHFVQAAGAFKTALRINPRLTAAEKRLAALPDDIVEQAPPLVLVASKSRSQDQLPNVLSDALSQNSQNEMVTTAPAVETTQESTEQADASPQVDQQKPVQTQPAIADVSDTEPAADQAKQTPESDNQSLMARLINAMVADASESTSSPQTQPAAHQNVDIAQTDSVVSDAQRNDTIGAYEPIGPPALPDEVAEALEQGHQQELSDSRIDQSVQDEDVIAIVDSLVQDTVQTGVLVDLDSQSTESTVISDQNETEVATTIDTWTDQKPDENDAVSGSDETRIAGPVEAPEYEIDVLRWANLQWSSLSIMQPRYGPLASGAEDIEWVVQDNDPFKPQVARWIQRPESESQASPQSSSTNQPAADGSIEDVLDALRDLAENRREGKTSSTSQPASTTQPADSSTQEPPEFEMRAPEQLNLSIEAELEGQTSQSEQNWYAPSLTGVPGETEPSTGG